MHKIFLSVILLIGTGFPLLFFIPSVSLALFDIAYIILAIAAVISIFGVWIGKSWGYLGGLILSLLLLLFASIYGVLAFFNPTDIGQVLFGVLVLPLLVIAAISSLFFWIYWKKQMSKISSA